jgi:5-methylcytosine-specific restriction protein A
MPKKAKSFIIPSLAKKKDTTEFYDHARWRHLRWSYLVRNPLCVDPYKVHCGQPALATEVDHKKPRRLHPELAYVWENLQGLCKPCHTRKTNHDILAAQVGRGRGRQ